MRVLVTGATGFVGWNVLGVLPRGWEVVPVVHRHLPAGLAAHARHCRLEEPDQVRALLDEAQPEAVLHLAACAKPDDCERDPAATHALNAEAPAVLAAACARAGVRLLHASTDMVFGGGRAPYGEDDARCPLNVYGRQKAEAEARVLEACPQALVCRLPLMFGWAGPHAVNFLPAWVASMRAGRPLRVFVDQWRTPLSGPTAAAMLCRLLACGAAGVVNVAGAERLSRHELALLIADVFGTSAAALSPCRQAEAPAAAFRPADVSMTGERAWALAGRPPGLREQLAGLVNGEGQA